MSDLATEQCVCGHLWDEHDLEVGSPPCEVDGCPCFAYEWDGEDR